MRSLCRLVAAAVLPAAATRGAGPAPRNPSSLACALPVAVLAFTLLLASACGSSGAPADRSSDSGAEKRGGDAASSGGATTPSPETTRETTRSADNEQTVESLPGGAVVRGGAVLVRQGGRPSEEPGISPTALISGELTVGDGGCLRIRDGSSGHLPVWPPGYSLRAEGGDLAVLDHDGRVVANVGDRVTFGGGETRRGEAGPDYWRKRRELDVPAACPGPLWGVVPPIRVEEGKGSTG